LSPLHSRVLSLMQQLPLDTTHYVCGMDNLFISPKFAKVMYNESGKQIMIHGVLGSAVEFLNVLFKM
jgi:hypothetical protein